MDFVQSFIKDLYPLSIKSLEELHKILIQKKYTKKTIISKKGKTPKNLYFLTSGLARAFIIQPNGAEYSRNIYTKGDVMGSYSAILKNRLSISSIECLTDCEVLECNYSKFMELSNKYIDIGILSRKLLEILYVVRVNRNIDFITLNTTEIYLKLRENIPEIDTLINQKIIASHLAITTVQLSRIRKKLLLNN